MKLVVLDTHMTRVCGTIDVKKFGDAIRVAKALLHVRHPVIDLQATPDGMIVFNNLKSESQRLYEKYSDA